MPLSVTEMLARLKRAVEGEVGEQSVVGEIGTCKTAGSGHIYFTIKDESAQLQCVLYRYQAVSCRVHLREGLRVELEGRASVWEGRGSLQFLVSRVKEAGKGSLQQQFEALKQKLAAEGLFDPARKRALPPFPQSVGLITSATGAVIQDMRHRLASRAPWMQAYLLPVQVQGKGAELGIARAIEQWSEPEKHGLPRVDYLILARGGGSLEDLWCFNEEVVARAIARCSLPIISAIGHETDFTIADFVADLRAPTPTAAIELSTPDGAALDAWLTQTEKQLRLRLVRELETARLRLRVAEQGKLRTPLNALAPFAQKLDALEEELHRSWHQRTERENAGLGLYQARLSTRVIREALTAAHARLQSQHLQLLRAFTARMTAARSRLETQEARLSAASPRHALQRGFALVRTPQHKLARHAAELPPGTPLSITLASGYVEATVTRNHPEP